MVVNAELNILRFLNWKHDFAPKSLGKTFQAILIVSIVKGWFHWNPSFPVFFLVHLGFVRRHDEVQLTDFGLRIVIVEMTNSNFIHPCHYEHAFNLWIQRCREKFNKFNWSPDNQFSSPHVNKYLCESFLDERHCFSIKC